MREEFYIKFKNITFWKNTNRDIINILKSLGSYKFFSMINIKLKKFFVTVKTKISKNYQSSQNSNQILSLRIIDKICIYLLQLNYANLYSSDIIAQIK